MLARRVAAIFRLDEEGWQRHANPWSVWNGVVLLEMWPTLTGLLLVYAGKLWFLDRMVWLYSDMKDASPEYASWSYGQSPPG